jgi:hypothetical protein
VDAGLDAAPGLDGTATSDVGAGTGTPDAPPGPDASDATSSGADGPPRRLRAFVTRARYAGDIRTAGGTVAALEGADALCKGAADGASLGGKFIAWFQTLENLDPYTRITAAGPWYLVDGTTLVFATKTALKASPIHTIDRDELGGPVDTNVWGGSAGGCSDWTSSSQADDGEYLSTVPPATLVQSSGLGRCSSTHGILCFEQ